MKLETQKNIGQNLRILRLSKGLSQSQLADITGISRNLYAAYELGNRTTDAEFLYQLSGVFGFEMSIFFEKTPELFLRMIEEKELFDKGFLELSSLYKQLSVFSRGRLLERGQWLLSMDSQTRSRREAIYAKKP